MVPVVAPVINFHVYTTDQWSLSLTCADMKRSEFYCEYEYLLPQTGHPPPAIKGHKPHKSTQKNINFLKTSQSSHQFQYFLYSQFYSDLASDNFINIVVA